MSMLTVMRGKLLPTKTYHTREWTFVAMPCRLHLADGTIAIHQERGRKSESRRYAIQETDSCLGNRVFLLEAMGQQIDTIPACVSDNADNGPYKLIIRKERNGSVTVTCSCMAAKRSYCCKHADVVGAILEDGGLMPADESDIADELCSVQEDTPYNPVPVKQTDWSKIEATF